MKKLFAKSISLVIISLLMVGLFSCSDDDESGISSELNFNNETYENLVEKRLSNLPENAQVSIGLVHNNTIEYLGAINEEEQLKSIDNSESIFEIGSITKVFAGICLADMHLKNEIDINDQIQEYFNFPIKNGGEITLEQLALHNSGLPRLPTNVDEVINFDIKDPYANYSFDNLKSYLVNHVELNHPIGTTYEYSNLGFGILGYILSIQNDTTFEKLLKDRILNPLDMSETSSLLENINQKNLVIGRDRSGKEVPHWTYQNTFTAAGSIKSSVNDTVKFIKKNFEDSASYNFAQEKRFQQEGVAYSGFGWGIIETDAFQVLTHDGGTGGFSSILMMDKRKQTGVIILANVNEYHEAIIPLCNDLFLEINK